MSAPHRYNKAVNYGFQLKRNSWKHEIEAKFKGNAWKFKRFEFSSLQSRKTRNSTKYFSSCVTAFDVSTFHLYFEATTRRFYIHSALIIIAPDMFFTSKSIIITRWLFSLLSFSSILFSARKKNSRNFTHHPLSWPVKHIKKKSKNSLFLSSRCTSFKIFKILDCRHG